MKITWKGRWKNGEVTIEAENSEELLSTLTKLGLPESIAENVIDLAKVSSEFPKISGNSGPSQAVRDILSGEWGKTEPRAMKEINAVLEANAIYFSSSSLSGVLTNLVKKGELKRSKKDDQWAYVLLVDT